MMIRDIVRNALIQTAAKVTDAAFVIAYSCVRSNATHRGAVLASVQNASVDPFSEDAANTKLEAKVIVFLKEGDGGWNHPFDPQIGDVFTIENKRYSTVSVVKKYDSYYKAEVRSC